MFENSRRRTLKWVVSSNCKVSGYISCLILCICVPSCSYPTCIAHSPSFCFPVPRKISEPEASAWVPSLHPEVGAKHSINCVTYQIDLSSPQEWDDPSMSLVSHFIFFFSFSAYPFLPNSPARYLIPRHQFYPAYIQICRVLSALDLLNLPR